MASVKPQVGDVFLVHRLWGQDRGRVIAVSGGNSPRVTVKIPLRGAWGDEHSFEVLTVPMSQLEPVAGDKSVTT
jgi:hypothetical protein